MRIKPWRENPEAGDAGIADQSLRLGLLRRLTLVYKQDPVANLPPISCVSITMAIPSAEENSWMKKLYNGNFSKEQGRFFPLFGVLQGKNRIYAGETSLFGQNSDCISRQFIV